MKDISTTASMPRRIQRAAKVIVVFRNDDPSAVSNLKHEREIFGLFERFGVPQTLAVVPRVALTDLHDPQGLGERLLSDNREILAFLKDYAMRTGSEIALHGYTHRANRFSDPARREYAEFKYLPLAEQEEMIRAGLEILENAFGTRPVTFVPPWNRWDDNTIAACVSQGCRIISAGPNAAVSSDIVSFGSNTNLENFLHDFHLAKQGSKPVFLNVLFHSNTLTPAQKSLLTQILETIAQDSVCQTACIAEAAESFAKELRLVNEAGRNVVPVYQVAHSTRSRAWLYLATSIKFIRFDPLKRLLCDANKLYRTGDYSACHLLTPQVEKVCAKILWGGRILTFLIGVIISAAGGVLFRSMGFHPLLFFQCLLPFTLGCSGTLYSKTMISIDTRKEVFLLGWLAAGGGVVAIIVRACI